MSVISTDERFTIIHTKIILMIFFFVIFVGKHVLGTHQNGLLMTIQCNAAAAKKKQKKKKKKKQINSVLFRLAISLDKRNCGVGWSWYQIMIFLIPPEKKMLWVLIIGTLPTCFLGVSQQCVFLEK